jgi:hypothetical protein
MRDWKTVPAVFVWGAWPEVPPTGQRGRDLPGVRGPVCGQDGERTVRDEREEDGEKMIIPFFH